MYVHIYTTGAILFPALVQGLGLGHLLKYFPIFCATKMISNGSVSADIIVKDLVVGSCNWTNSDHDNK